MDCGAINVGLSIGILTATQLGTGPVRPKNLTWLLSACSPWERRKGGREPVPADARVHLRHMVGRLHSGHLGSDIRALLEGYRMRKGLGTVTLLNRGLHDAGAIPHV